MTSPVIFVIWPVCEYRVSVGDKLLEVEFRAKGCVQL